MVETGGCEPRPAVIGATGHRGGDPASKAGTSTTTCILITTTFKPIQPGRASGSRSLPACLPRWCREGWYVQINHGNGVSTMYCHMLQRPRVTIGQKIAAGQVLGRVGSSGNSSGDHLHFEVHLLGAPIEPESWMQARGAPLGLH